ncbi:hypothetical protein PQR57_44580 [Paraburkholderia dipogonis]|uniref:Uncharacterized protein n=1 Tax=Paraburkholderia dipogonis TaxID=1211383 RepID=A0ABW9B6T3_9BURK
MADLIDSVEPLIAAITCASWSRISSIAYNTLRLLTPRVSSSMLRSPPDATRNLNCKLRVAA